MLLWRIRTTAFESFAARQGHGAAIGHGAAKLGTETGNDNLESRGNRVSLPSESEQRVGRAEFKAPVGDFAVGFGDVDIKPRMRIDEIELRDLSRNFDWLLNIELGCESVVCGRGHRRQKKSETGKCEMKFGSHRSDLLFAWRIAKNISQCLSAFRARIFQKFRKIVSPVVLSGDFPWPRELVGIIDGDFVINRAGIGEREAFYCVQCVGEIGNLARIRCYAIEVRRVHNKSISFPVSD